MEETVDHDVLRPAPGRESPDGAPARTDPDRSGLTLLDRTFGRDEITVVRHEVTARLDRGALGDRLHGFVLAINEIITNAVLHAGGHGRIVLWGTAGSLWCTVTDSGPGYRSGSGIRRRRRRRSRWAAGASGWRTNCATK